MHAHEIAALAAGKYVDWGVISNSLTNLLIIIGMVVDFVLALVVPFPHAHEDELPPEERS